MRCYDSAAFGRAAPAVLEVEGTMRVLVLVAAALVVVMAVALERGRADAATVPLQPAAVVASPQQEKPVVDDHDGSRVGVQLVVAGIAAGVVVVLGSGAYLLRRRLGLTAPPPEQGAGGHH